MRVLETQGMADLVAKGVMNVAVGGPIFVRRGQPYVPCATMRVGIIGAGTANTALTYANGRLPRIFRELDEFDVNDALDFRENRPHLLLNKVAYFPKVTQRRMLIINSILRNFLWEAESYAFT